MEKQIEFTDQKQWKNELEKSARLFPNDVQSTPAM